MPSLFFLLLFFYYCCPVKLFQTKQIRADTSHEVSALLVIFVFAKLKHNHEQR